MSAPESPGEDVTPGAPQDATDNQAGPTGRWDVSTADAGGSTGPGGSTGTSGGGGGSGPDDPGAAGGGPGVPGGESGDGGSGPAGSATGAGSAPGNAREDATGPVFGEPGTRHERWDCDGPAEIEATIGGGRVEIDLTDPGSGVTVQVRAEPGGGAPWQNGLGGLLDWLGSMSGGGMPPGAGGAGRGFDPIVGAPWERTGDPSAAAVEATTVTWSESARRLVVRGPDSQGLAGVPLVVTVSAPRGSRLAARTGAADVTVRGQARWAAVRTGSGAARLEEVDGDVDVTTGSGGIELGAVAGRARLRAGSGVVDVAALAGPSQLRTGSGDVRVGEITADVEVRTGSGDVVLADAVAGSLHLTTGSGAIRAGVHAGVAAELDLSSGSGRARSDLDVGGVAPESPAVLKIGGRTGSGDIWVTRATPVPA
ncbi:DUF4097 family beta strand repeat-containing protein [Pseudonocardia endophytica]|uniref:DUF4097 domain-containing protein n=1 Tax=Pseudonocardia endophytica TaxID=401976 RepID=A0A4R1HWB4_PSEEN|nr:DUF4097 family beta strand repeat-containing protein [Pseudonocardia endophytica]TCK25325.1 hypothetical protein EV378_1129 [Pseudonocardia endophytica]